MRYWWVNQNQTFTHEVTGGYLWSPKRKKDETRNRFYDNMREVSPGDLVFSFSDTYIKTVGIAQSYASTSPKPDEFKITGTNWGNIGWKVNVAYTPLTRPFRPKDHMALLGPLLPSIYSPLQANGNGNQGVYLTELTPTLAGALLDLTGPDGKIAQEIAHATTPVSDDLDALDSKLENAILQNEKIPNTTRTSLVQARRGQGLFRSQLFNYESRCRITGVENPAHLIASHTKPWREADDKERLDGENGLLLTPSIDHLFDRGFIGFKPDGSLVISPVADLEALHRIGVPKTSFNVGSFTTRQKFFLEYHLDLVFLKAVSDSKGLAPAL